MLNENLLLKTKHLCRVSLMGRPRVLTAEVCPAPEEEERGGRGGGGRRGRRARTSLPGRDSKGVRAVAVDGLGCDFIIL